MTESFIALSGGHAEPERERGGGAGCKSERAAALPPRGPPLNSLTARGLIYEPCERTRPADVTEGRRAVVCFALV